MVASAQESLPPLQDPANTAQRRAVEHSVDRLLIIAGQSQVNDDPVG